MQRTDQHSKLVLLYVLQLVDKYHQHRVRRFRGLADLDKKRREVSLQVAVVRQACERLKIQSDFNVLVFHLEALGQASECLQRPLRQSFCRFELAQPQQRQPQRRGQHRRQ